MMGLLRGTFISMPIREHPTQTDQYYMLIVKDCKVVKVFLVPLGPLAAVGCPRLYEEK